MKFGRNVSSNRPPPASWDQTGPTTIWRGEISQIFSSEPLRDGSYSSLGGFSLTPEGGTDVNDLYIDPQGQYIGSYLSYSTPSGPSSRSTRTAPTSSTRAASATS